MMEGRMKAKHLSRLVFNQPLPPLHGAVTSDPHLHRIRNHIVLEINTAIKYKKGVVSTWISLWSKSLFFYIKCHVCLSPQSTWLINQQF